MDCEALGPESDEWLSCDNPNDFDDPIFCNGLQKSFFDINVTDEQDNLVVPVFNGAEGTTITNIEPGTQYNVKEIKYPVSTTANQLQAFPPSEESCVLAGFQDGGSLGSTLGVTYTPICIEYEDEEGNDCSTTTIAAGEEKTCIVKNYISLASAPL